MNLILSTDYFINGVYCGNTAEPERVKVVRKIKVKTTGLSERFLCRFSTKALKEYLERLLK